MTNEVQNPYEVKDPTDLSRFHYPTGVVPSVRVIDSRFKADLSKEFMSTVHGAFGSNRFAEVMDVSGIEHLVQLAKDGFVQETKWISADEWRSLRWRD